MAVVRFLPEQSTFQLEYPVGTVLYRNTGFMRSVRISPDGDHVAFLDHPSIGDDRGAVAVVDRKGNYTKVSGDLGSVSGVAWASNDQLWFSAATALLATDLSAKQKQKIIYSSSTRVNLYDIKNGRVLLGIENYRYGMLALAAGEQKERDISWLDWPVPRDISADGKRILFTEEGVGAGSSGEKASYATYLGYTDGSPAVKLGDGDAEAISPDGQSVVAFSITAAPQVLLLPTGAGEPRQITHDNITHDGCSWYPDGKRLNCFGNEPGHGVRNYDVDIATGKTTPVTPEGTFGHWLSPDGRYLLLFNNKLWKLDGGGAIDIRGIGPDDILLNFASGANIFVARKDGATAHISTVNPFTGEREPLRDIATPPVAGFRMADAVISADGRAYAYRYALEFDDLYTLTGLH
jgi:dipeptidyl aminopeptidase/acylaminoacyl peptidase